MREHFSVNDDKGVRLWNKYLTNTFEPLNNKDNTVQDAGLYEGQVRAAVAYLVYFCHLFVAIFGCRLSSLLLLGNCY